jgi:cation:H+ antiporter
LYSTHIEEKYMDVILKPIETFVSINWFTAIVGLVAGFALLWLSADVVTRKISPIARFFGVQELVVTILGISILSSMPEFFVSFISNLKGHPDTSIGNIIGSNFVTLTFVTSICGMVSPMIVKKEIKERESTWMILSSSIILILAIDGKLSRIDGIILVLLYIPYILSVIFEARRNSSSDESGSESRVKDRFILLHIGICCLAIVGIIVGAELAVQAGTVIGRRAHIPEATLGLIILACGTSLPEMAISLTAIIKKKADVTISEIYASNIFTAMFVLGVICIISPMQTSDPVIINFSLPFLILSGVTLQIFITTGSRFIRLEAIVVFALYCYFILGLFFKVGFAF